MHKQALPLHHAARWAFCSRLAAVLRDIAGTQTAGEVNLQAPSTRDVDDVTRSTPPAPRGGGR